VRCVEMLGALSNDPNFRLDERGFQELTDKNIRS
jgi:hypothetical protein